jgi:type IV pilus assembly protein PilM
MKWGWKGSFRLERSEVLGLDIGSSKVKLIQLRKSGDGYTVTAAGINDIPSSEDNSRKQANTVTAVRECLRSAGTQTPMAICGLCGPEVAVRGFKFPALPAEEVEGAVLLEAAQVCPFTVADDTQRQRERLRRVSGGNK